MRTPHRALPTILFGAFDRHNFGDLLFPHIAARLLGGNNLLFAGLVERDLRSSGGFQTRSITRLAKELGTQPINLIHVGGELLSCDAWQAAVMVQPPEHVQSIINRLEGHAEERQAWARNVLGDTGQAPYIAPHEMFPGAVNLIFTAVGGVELNERDEKFRTEVITKVRTANYVSVRDRQTLAHLTHADMQAHLVPDPAALVALLFGEQIERRSRAGEVAAIKSLFSQGYIAVQFSADFGDDATLGEIGAQLDRVIESNGTGIVFFRAGVAPWHDDRETYRRLMQYMRLTQVKIFESIDIWDICGLIANSRAYCGSSLHGRIVAMAFGLPRVNLNHPHHPGHSSKQVAYADTWETSGIPSTIEVSGIAEGIHQCLGMERAQLQIHASSLASNYLEEFATIQTLLGTRSK